MIPIGTSVPLRDVSAAVIGLIFANLLMFLVQSGMPATLAEQFIAQNALIPARYFDPDFAAYHGLVRHNYWPLLTNQFMHAGWLHLIVNMWTLWVIGRPLEQRIGPFRFILFYLACGLIADAAHIASDPFSVIPALGASGAIAGILGGYAVMYPRTRVHLITPVLFFPVTYRLPAVAFVAIWFGIQVLQGVGELLLPAGRAGIAWWAHIGGFIAGLILVRAIGTAKQRVREIDIAPAAVGARGADQAGGRTVGAERGRTPVIGAARGRSRVIGAALRRKRAAKSSSRGKQSAVRAGGSRWKSAVAAFERFKKEANLGSGSGSSDDTLSRAPTNVLSGTRPSGDSLDPSQPAATRRERSMIPSAGSASGRNAGSALAGAPVRKSSAWNRSR